MHQGRQLFEGLPSPFSVGRYHSLVVELDNTCAPDLMVTARSEEGEIMAIAHHHQRFPPAAAALWSSTAFLRM